MKYFDELKRSMEFLAEDTRTVFIGQAVEVAGTAMFNTLRDVPLEKRLELPVAEEMQMGMTLGLGLQGLIPVSIYPRWNFLLLAINQLVNHIDKIDAMSNGGYQPKLIIRTGIGSAPPASPVSARGRLYGSYPADVLHHRDHPLGRTGRYLSSLPESLAPRGSQKHDPGGVR